MHPRDPRPSTAKDAINRKSCNISNMNFFEKIFTSEKNDGVKNLHKDFTKTQDGFWYFNREFNILSDRGLNIKAKVFFEDPSLLDDCGFLAKIGKNLDESILLPYIGFVYGKNEERVALQAWAEKFPHAEMIFGLDESGVMKDNSEVISLKKK